MSEKRFTVFVKSILDNENDKFLMPNEIADMLNGLVDENEQLRFQLQNTSMQRDEFLQGARENSDEIAYLRKENEQLRKKVEKLQSILHIVECVGEYDE